MEFRILGPLEVLEGERRVPLRGSKQRAILAVLLLHSNEVVSTERLIDDVWDEKPPVNALNALQARILQLRKALGSEYILTRDSGYLLEIEPDRIDAYRFERLYSEASRLRAEGADDSAASALREALDLWRGPALADFAYEPFAQGEIVRLEELRLAAVQERVEADLALGREHELVGELEALVGQHPFREGFRGQLMMALYRSGRQAEALAAYQDTRRVLVEELGIQPSPALQRLEKSILLQESELEPAAAKERPPASSEPVPRTTRKTRKTVTVVCVEVEGSASGLDPEKLHRLRARSLDAIAAIVVYHGGTVERTSTVGIEAVFGVPTLHEDDALRALRAASEIREALAGLDGERAAVRIGIDSGEVVTGFSAPSSVVTGEVVSTAAKLRGAARPGEILAGSLTRRLAGDAITAEPVKEAWRVLEVVPGVPPIARHFESPLVGREDDLSLLRQALGRIARERTFQLITVFGTAGIGKTRLAQDFVSLVDKEASVLSGRCLPYGEGITFWPLREIVEQAAPDGEIAELVAGEENAEVIAERVGAAIRPTEAPGSIEETFWAVRRLFEALARKRPLVLVFEDIHWAEPTLLALLEYLADWSREAPILILCLARPELLEERPTWAGGKVNAASILLEPLDENESEVLISNLPGTEGISSSARAQITEAAEGNPLFLEQMVAMVGESWPTHGELPVPHTIQALLAARLEQLGPGERAVLERAAIVGKEFLRSGVVELLPEEGRASAARHLEALVRKELLRPSRSGAAGVESLRFRHILIQQSAYRAIPKELRAELHERFAAWLEEEAEESLAEGEELVGYHLEQAFRYRAELGPVDARERQLARRAAAHLLTAGRRAFRSGDMPASANLLGRAASLLPLDDRGRLELLPDLSHALFEIGELDRARTVLDEAVERGRSAGNRGVEWRAVVERGLVQLSTEPETVDSESVSKAAGRAIEVLTELGDDSGLARAWILLAEVCTMIGDLVQSAEAAGRAAEAARRAGSRRQEAWALGTSALCLNRGSIPVAEGVRRLEELVRESRRDPVMEANLSGFFALQQAMAGNFEEAREHMQRGRALTDSLGLRWQLAVHHWLSGDIEMLAGDPAAAERDLRAAYEIFGEIGDRWLLAAAAVDLARAVYEQGRYDDAAVLADAFDDVPTPADLEWQIKRRAIRSRLLARRGQMHEAEVLAREAVAHASGTDFLGFHGDALMGLAEVLELAGRPREAVTAAAEALQLYEKKGLVPSARRAQALRAELAKVTPISSR